MRQAVARDLGVRQSRWWWVALVICVLLLLTVLVLDLMHRLYHTQGVFEFAGHHWFDSDADRSMSEMIGYLQSLTSSILLLYFAVAVGKGWTFLVLGQAMLVVVLDDYMRLHEELRGTFIDLLGLQGKFGLRSEDVGELMAWGFIGLPILIAFILAWRYSRPEIRKKTKPLLIALGALIFFAAVIDMIAILGWQVGIEPGVFGWQGRVYYVLTMIESLGELGAQSAILLIAIYLALQFANKNKEAGAAPAEAGQVSNDEVTNH